MNDKIINGIDVSECEYLNKVVNEEPYCNIDEEHLCTCSSNKNCYFKQLKRLQQQIEAYQLSENEAKEIIAEFKHKNKRLQEENEELKANKGRCAFKCLDNTFCDEARIKIDKLELDKDCLNVSLETSRKYRGIAETDRDKYKQALEEIRDVAQIHQYFNPELLEIKGDIGQMQDLKMTEIYNKCNEVLNDRD